MDPSSIHFSIKEFSYVRISIRPDTFSSPDNLIIVEISFDVSSI